MPKPNRKELAALLPKEPTKAELNPSSLAWLFIAPPKWGKTEFFMSNPDAVLLAIEEGHKFQRGYKMIIDCWDKRNYENWTDDEGCKHMTFMQAISALEEFDKFNFVIIDTAVMLAKMCADFHCEQGGVEHLQDLGDYGKGYDVGLNSPFRKAIMRILKTGRGVGFIAHTHLEIARFTTGEKARKEAKLPKEVKYLLESQADIIVHGELGKRRDGKRLRDRILVCEGDADTMAGNRTGAMMPERYIVRRGKAWEQVMSFFKDPTASEKEEKIYAKHYKSKSKDE